MRLRGAALCAALLLAPLAGSAGEPPANPFFAMDNIARGGPEVAPRLLRELGYDGFGGRVPDEAMAPAISAQGLRFFNGYHVITLDPAHPAPDENLRRWLTAMGPHRTTLWLAIGKVARPGGGFHGISSPEADAFVADELRAIATAAQAAGFTVALYPHAGFWLARFEDALRVAALVGRPDVGVTFNLCHWLKVEGSQRDPLPLIRQSLPSLRFVTISGADQGDTRAMGWDRLIQPLDQGTYDVGGFVRQIRAAGYSGPVGFQGYNIKGEPREILARSIGAWRRFLAPAP